MGIRRLLGRARPDDAMDVPATPITIEPIGVVRSRLRDLRPRDTKGDRAEIRLREAFASGLAGLGGFSHAFVLTWLDRVSDEERATLGERPGGIAALPEVGVFALRTHHRPNPLGLTVVRIERVEGGTVHVVGLDAIDGTPVLDIKPYLPPYDSVRDARLPAWAIGHEE